jgi:hypothetical protein
LQQLPPLQSLSSVQVVDMAATHTPALHVSPSLQKIVPHITPVALVPAVPSPVAGVSLPHAAKITANSAYGRKRVWREFDIWLVFR